ncbi:hypothetical protein [Occallatibacter savannae]|uniref:hypothetical protein n=1 Tax=Occallatibacter savannae TaxID=1002691 RepID=UPI000D698EC1|nr:hypothetical protein [Occallatibacter savannae]
MDITVNLANQPYIDSRPIIRALRVAIVVAASLTVIAATTAFFVNRKAQEARRQERSVELSMSSMQAEQRAYQSTMRSDLALNTARQADELNQIFDAKAFSWTGVMQDLERVLPSKVQVTAIEPTRTKEGAITLHLRVVGPHEKSIDLLRNLEESRSFVDPRIVGESLANNLGSGQKSIAVDASTMMEFDLLTGYNDAARDPKITDTSAQQASHAPSATPSSASKAIAALTHPSASIGGLR